MAFAPGLQLKYSVSRVGQLSFISAACSSACFHVLVKSSSSVMEQNSSACGMLSISSLPMFLQCFEKFYFRF